MHHFMKPPELKVIHNYGDNTLGYTCIDVISDYDYQRDWRLNAFPIVLEATHIKGKSIGIGFSIMGVGFSIKFRYKISNNEIWKV